MKYLIMVNTKYPYRAGEAFLESEIRETSQYFDKILIFPIDTVVGDKRTRSIEYANVQDFVFEKEKTIYRKNKIKILSFFNLYKYTGKLKERCYDSFFETSALSQARKIENILDTINFDKNDQIVLYSYWFYIPARIIVALKEYFANRGVTTIQISRAHRFDIYENKTRPLPQRKLLLKEMDRVFACSRDGADYIKTKYPEYADKIEVSLLGTYDHGVEEYDMDSTFSVVSCSRVTNIKRVHLIAEAVLILQKKGYPIKWTHIGDGPQMQEVRALVDGKVIDHVRLLGAISNIEVYDYYKTNNCSVFINVSSSEGLPVSIMEATSFGIPVIGTDVGGTREIAVDNVTGKLLKGNPTAEEVADALESLYLMDKQEYMFLRQSTREFWNSNFNAINNYRAFINEIENLSLFEK